MEGYFNASVMHAGQELDCREVNWSCEDYGRMGASERLSNGPVSKLFKLLVIGQDLNAARLV